MSLGKACTVLYGNHTSVKNISWVKRVLDSNPKSLRNEKQVYKKNSFDKLDVSHFGDKTGRKHSEMSASLRRAPVIPFANVK